jgi:hypothetical protein
MRVINALRDAEQHWFTIVEEDLLYLHTRAVITVFDAYLMRALDLDLSSKTARVLPVSTKPPGDFDFLVDREYTLVSELLKPGKRKRTRLAPYTCSPCDGGSCRREVQISERDIDRSKSCEERSELGEVFPRLTRSPARSMVTGRQSHPLFLGKRAPREIRGR